MSNDFVAMETNLCPVCGIEHSYNTGILIDKRMKKIKNTLSGYSLCQEHDRLFNDGYLALIEVTNDHTTNEVISLKSANRTGKIAFVRRELADKMFNVSDARSLMFIDREAMSEIEKIHNQIEETEET